MINENTKQMSRFILMAGIVVIAFNLRPAITSVGPVIGLIRDDIGLSNWNAGLLTSLPLVAFAVISPIAPRFGNRFSNERTLLAGLLFLFIGISVRVVPSVGLLFFGTFLIGIGIAILNVLLPGVVKEKFPSKVGVMTSLYSTAMGIFAAAASGLSIPIAKGFDLGWQVALFVWALPAVVGIILWVYISKKSQSESEVEMEHISVGNKLMVKSPLAWQVACFMGFQSFLFYVTISWLPEILHSNGMSIATAGWMLSFAQFIGLPASFLVPVIAGRFPSQRRIVLVMGLFSLSGYGGLLIGDSKTVLIISTILIGLALSGSFALALTFLGMRAKTARQASELSGMAQSLGYILAAVGPMFIGLLFDITHSWNYPLMMLMVVAMLVVLFGMGAGRDRYVMEDT